MKDKILAMCGDFDSEFAAYVNEAIVKVAGVEVMSSSTISCDSLGCTRVGSPC
ncbi:hypothetical protein [Pseudomonas sp. NFX224]|uniref:hypothetical protein n=1 Tax=Pseudomonas sp. NFX224 TaxID=3402862 RepID=UPI003AFB2D02